MSQIIEDLQALLQERDHWRNRAEVRAANIDNLVQQQARVGKYIVERFPDLEWSEYSDPITALCDRLQEAEAENESLREKLADAQKELTYWSNR